eukprot:337791_1
MRKQFKLLMNIILFLFICLPIKIILQLPSRKMNIITNQQINTTETNQNIIFISSSCYSNYLSSNHLIFINNVVKLNPNRNILFFCGTLQCMKSIQDLQHKLAFANLFVYRLQLQTLANNTPLQSFLNDHPLNRLKRGREFMSDIQKISILLILSHRIRNTYRCDNLLDIHEIITKL